MESTRAYPLYWPEGWSRAKSHDVKRARFGDHSVSEGRRVLADQVRLFGGKDLIISSNLELGNYILDAHTHGFFFFRFFFGFGF